MSGAIDWIHPEDQQPEGDPAAAIADAAEQLRAGQLGPQAWAPAIFERRIFEGAPHWRGHLPFRQGLFCAPAAPLRDAALANVPNGKGVTLEAIDLATLRVCYVEIDAPTRPASIEAAQRLLYGQLIELAVEVGAGLPTPTLIVASGYSGWRRDELGKGLHLYWRLGPGPTPIETWRAIQAGLATLRGADPTLRHAGPRETHEVWWRPRGRQLWRPTNGPTHTMGRP